MTWLPWVMLPVVGAVIGYATNWVAIKMLFHPRRKRCGLQGLLPRRQAELARSIGRVVGDDLLSLEHLLQPLTEIDLEQHLGPVIDAVIERKAEEFQKIPLIGAMITPDRLSGLRDVIVRELGKHRDDIMGGLVEAAHEHIDIAALVESKVAAFDLDELEGVVHRVAKHELGAIELWGAVLGALIGVAQAGLLHFWA
ncbi:MAG: DUF445 domain-containing protein [Planctomycetota bacterium]|jgi:uncharacterized membrane protein YheB (UPF0754 family)